jgi:hypothetical protein
MPGIVPLKDLHNHKITSGDPDVRGWDVIAADGRKIGKVDDLLVDAGTAQVRLLEVDLDRDLLVPPAAGGPASPSPPNPSDKIDVGLALTEGNPVSPGVPAYGTTTPPATTGLGPTGEYYLRESLTEEENRLTGGPPPPSRTRHVLIPVGMARLAGEGRRLLVEGLSAREATFLPGYDGGEIDAAGEEALLARFDHSLK